MVMNKKAQSLLYIIVTLVLVVVIAYIVINFNQNSIGGVGVALSATDEGVIAAAGGCNPGLLHTVIPDPQKSFCRDFKTISKKSSLGFDTQEVNCDYLNNTIKAAIVGVASYGAISCPATVWVDRCQLDLNTKNDPSYSITINGKMCSYDELNKVLVADTAHYKTFSDNRYDKSKSCVLVLANTPVLLNVTAYKADGSPGIFDISKPGNEALVYYTDQAKCLAKEAPALVGV